MAQKDTIHKLFNYLNAEFDNVPLHKGHQARFLNKLRANTPKPKTLEHRKKSWGLIFAIAASVVLCFSIITFVINTQTETLDLANLSPELSETQDFFTTTLHNEIKKLNAERSPFTEKVIEDALQQIQTLEDEYQNLRNELTIQSKNERIIYAMISNFQNRIDILNTVLEHIETIKQFNTQNDETTTI